MTGSEIKGVTPLCNMAAAALLLALMVGCKEKTVAAPLPTAVRVTTVERERVGSDTRYSATVKELQKVDLSFKVSGQIKELFQVREADQRTRDVQEGDRAPAGTVIAKLDSGDYVRRHQIAVERLQQAVNQQQAARAEAANAESDYQRAQILLARKVISQEQYDAAASRRDATRAAAAAAERETASAMVSEQQAKDDLANCELMVPEMSNALVAAKYVEKNERVAPNQRAFQLIELAKVRVVFGVPDTVVSTLRLRRPLRVVCEALGNAEFRGEVTKIAPAADMGTRTFPIEVTIDKPGDLRPGMIVTIHLDEQVEDMLLPMTAVQRGKNAGEFAVFQVTAENGQNVARKRRVDLGGVYDNRIQVKNTPLTEIKPGDRVVVTGASRLEEGQVVRVLETPELPPEI